MNFLKTIVVASIAILGTTFAQAAALEDMTPLERTAFRAEVRAYLLDNPEIILEAIEIMDKRQAQIDAISELALIPENSASLPKDGICLVG